MPLLIGIKQRYPSIYPHTPLHLHLFVNRVGSLTRHGQTPPVRHIILVLSPIVAFLLGGTTCTRRASVVKLTNFKGRKILSVGPCGEPCHVRTFQLVIARCRHSAINFLRLEYDEPHNGLRPIFFHGPSQDRRRWKSLMYYTTSKPAPNTGYLQRKRHHLRVDLCPPVHTNNVDAASTHVQVSHHTPLWIFASMLVRPGGALEPHMASHLVRVNCRCRGVMP